MKRLAIAVLLAPLSVNPSFAQEAPQQEEHIEAVQVTSARDPEFKTYRAFVAGVDVFEQRKELAPLAHKTFRLRTLEPAPDFRGVTMRIAGEEESVAVPVEADGSFTMPRNQQMFDENAEIILNRKKGMFRWRPHVVTPGLPPNTRRLGDLRLECAVRWAVEKSDMGFARRALFSALGGPCTTRNIIVWQQADKAIASIHLSAQERREALGKSAIKPKSQVYTLPLHDKSWPDDTLVEFTYAGEEAKVVTPPAG
jgi:hypothetical protein